MNQRISFSLALFGYSLAAQVRLADETMESYRRIFTRFDRFLDNHPPLESITAKEVRTYLAGLGLSPKTVLNHQIALSLWWSHRTGYFIAHFLVFLDTISLNSLNRLAQTLLG